MLHEKLTTNLYHFVVAAYHLPLESKKIKMNKIKTISGKSEFSYTGSCDEGFYLEYTGRPFVSSELIKKAINEFKGKTIQGGFNVSNPSGFGAWVEENSKMTSRHASHIAAVLVHEEVIECEIRGNKINLKFK